MPSKDINKGAAPQQCHWGGWIVYWYGIWDLEVKAPLPSTIDPTHFFFISKKNLRVIVWLILILSLLFTFYPLM